MPNFSLRVETRPIPSAKCLMLNQTSVKAGTEEGLFFATIRAREILLFLQHKRTGERHCFELLFS